MTYRKASEVAALETLLRQGGAHRVLNASEFARHVRKVAKKNLNEERCLRGTWHAISRFRELVKQK